MTRYDFTTKDKTGIDVITFGTPKKSVSIDVTFVPADLGYQIKGLMPKDTLDTIPPETLAKIIALFTNDVDAEWIVANTDYGTLNKIAVIIINKAFGREPEKN